LKEEINIGVVAPDPSNIELGDLVFQNCYVDVVEKSVSTAEDGLLGTDVLGSSFVELDFPEQKMMPCKLPEDPSREHVGLQTQKAPTGKFHDRYVAPGMKSFPSIVSGTR